MLRLLSVQGHRHLLRGGGDGKGGVLPGGQPAGLCRQEGLGAFGDMLLEEVGSRGGGLGSGGHGDLGLGHGVLEDLQKIDGGHGGGGG